MLTLGIIISLISATSWAVGTILFEKIGKEMTSAAITFFKSLISIFLMVLLLFIWGFEHVSERQMLLLALSGILGISVGDTLFFNSLKCIGAKTQVIYFVLGQVVTIILSYLFLGEVLPIIQYIGAVVIVCGVLIVIIGKQDGHLNKIKGIIYGFLAMLCYSFSIIITKEAVCELSAVTTTFYRMLFSGIFILFSGFFSHKIKEWSAPLKEKKIRRLFFLNVVIVTYGGFLMSVLALKLISVSLASILATTETIFTLFFAYLISKEQPLRKEIVGAVITILGVLLLICY